MAYPSYRPGRVLSFGGVQQGPQDTLNPNQPIDLNQMGVPPMPPPTDMVNPQQGPPPPPPPPMAPQGPPQGPPPMPPAPTQSGPQGIPPSPNGFNITPQNPVPNTPYSGGPGGVFSNDRPPGMPPPTGDQPFDINSVYHPEHTGIDRMNAMGPPPNLQDWKPSLLRKILGYTAMAAGGGGNAADSIINGPYNIQLEDWKRQFDTAGTMAGQERQANAVQRQMISSMLMNQNYDDRTREQIRAAMAREDTNATNAESTRLKVMLDMWKIQHPDSVIKVTDDGRLIGVNKQTNEADYVRDPDGKELKAPATLTPEQKQANALEQIDARGEVGLRLAAVRAAYAKELARLTSDLNMDEIEKRAMLRSLFPAAAASSGGSANADELARLRGFFNNALVMRDSDPKYKDWIEMGDPTTGTFTLKTPEEMTQNAFQSYITGGGNTPEQAQEIYAKLLEGIYGPDMANAFRKSTGLKPAPPSAITPGNIRPTAPRPMAPGATVTPRPGAFGGAPPVAPTGPQAGPAAGGRGGVAGPSVTPGPAPNPPTRPVGVYNPNNPNQIRMRDPHEADRNKAYHYVPLQDVPRKQQPPDNWVIE